jgi:WD40 repeat protein
MEGLPQIPNYIAWRPDSQRFASASLNESVVRLWSPDGMARGVVKLESNVQSAPAWSSDGKQFATCEVDRRVRMWTDLEADEPQSGSRLGAIGPQPAVAFNPQTGSLAICANDGIRVSEPTPQGWRTRWQLAVHHNTGDLAWSPDGSVIATANKFDGPINLWQPDGRRRRAIAAKQDKFTGGLRFSPDSQHLAAYYPNNYLSLIEVAKATSTTLAGKGDGINQVAWNHDGTRLAAAASDSIRIWDVTTGKVEHVLNGHTAAITFLAYSPDGARLVSGDEDNTVRFWNPGSGEAAGSLQGDVKSVRGVAWHPDGKRLASWGTEKAVRLWNAETGEPLSILAEFETPLRRGQWLAGGQQWLAVGEDAGRLAGYPMTNWDVADGKSLWKRQIPRGAYTGTFVSPDEKWIAAVNHGPSLLLDRVTGEARDLGSWGHPLTAWSPNSDRLAMKRGLELEVFNVNTGSIEWLGFVFDDKTAIAYTPAGEILNPTEELDKHLAYAVETLDGEIKLLSAAEFRKLAAGNLAVVGGAN